MNRQGEIREKIRISLEKHISSSGYTQKEIAEKLGVSKSSVTNWLKGKNSPDANLVMPICNLLNISIGQFYGEDDDTGTKKSTQKAPSYSDEAMKLAEDYEKHMDDRGRETVRGVADLEVARYKAILQEQHKKMEAAEESTPELVYFTIPRQLYAMGAGGGQYNDYQSTENQRLIKEPPRGTSYIAPVSGDSMEPTFHDGDLLFVRATVDIRPGQIGVFFMGGQQWVKEYGDGELISHNPAYDPEPFTEDVRCQGIVLGVCDNSYFEM